MTGARKEITRREVALLALGSAVLAVVMSWPLVLHLGETVPRDLGDPLAQAWQAAWGGHALADQPLEFFQSNQFWPLPDTLAFSDALVGYAPAGLLGSGPHDAIVRYDLLFVFAYALAFAGAYLLARELGLGPGPALVAGAAFAYAPFRLEQDGHLHVISSGGIPLALALGLRGYRLDRPLVVVAGFAVAAWQLSIGFSLGLPFAYLLAALGAVALVVWLRAGRTALPRPLVVATLVGALLFGASAYALSRPYERVREDHPQSERPPETVEAYSGPAKVFLVAPAENEVWGGATAGLRDGLENVPEKTLFPGLAILALAAFGLVRGTALPRGLRAGLAIGAVAVSVLAIGFQTEGGLLWPYRLVYEALPGWQGIRTPGRLVTFSSLALALLAAAGAAALLARPRGRALAATAAAGLALLVAVEGRGLPFDPRDVQAQPAVPATPPSVAGVTAPQIHLPADRPEDNRRYLLWSTDGFPDIVNGRSSVDPVLTEELIDDARGFPDAASVEALRDAGVASVVLHVGRAPGTDWSDAARKPVGGLGVERSRLGGLAVYDLTSAGSPDG